MEDNFIKEIYLGNKEDALANKDIIYDLYSQADENVKGILKKFYLTLLLFTCNIFLLCFGIVQKDIFLICVNLVGVFFSIRHFASIFEIHRLALSIKTELEVILKIVDCTIMDKEIKVEIDKNI